MLLKELPVWISSLLIQLKCLKGVYVMYRLKENSPTLFFLKKEGENQQTTRLQHLLQSLFLSFFLFFWNALGKNFGSLDLLKMFLLSLSLSWMVSAITLHTQLSLESPLFFNDLAAFRHWLLPEKISILLPTASTSACDKWHLSFCHRQMAQMGTSVMYGSTEQEIKSGFVVVSPTHPLAPVSGKSWPGQCHEPVPEALLREGKER